MYFSVPCSQVSLFTFCFPLIICTQNGSFRSFICVCSFSLFEKLSTIKKKRALHSLAEFRNTHFNQDNYKRRDQHIILIRHHGSRETKLVYSKNVTGKANSRCFKLYCSCSISYNLFNVGKSWSWFQTTVSKAYAKRRTFHETNQTLIGLRAEAVRPS